MDKVASRFLTAVKQVLTMVLTYGSVATNIRCMRSIAPQLRKLVVFTALSVLLSGCASSTSITAFQSFKLSPQSLGADWEEYPDSVESLGDLCQAAYELESADGATAKPRQVLMLLADDYGFAVTLQVFTFADMSTAKQVLDRHKSSVDADCDVPYYSSGPAGSATVTYNNDLNIKKIENAEEALGVSASDSMFFDYELTTTKTVTNPSNLYVNSEEYREAGRSMFLLLDDGVLLVTTRARSWLQKTDPPALDEVNSTLKQAIASVLQA